MNVRGAVLALALSALAARAHAAGIAGTVTADGHPVGGVSVAVVPFEPVESRALRMVAGDAARPSASAVTGADGSFRFEVAGPAALLSVRAPGYAPLLALALDDTPATLALTRAETVRGTVVAAGRPVAGAVLVFIGPDAGSQYTEWMTRTAADGTFEAPDPDRWAESVAILHPDHAPLFASPSPRFARRFALEPGRPVSGRVTERATGRGVAGASIWVDGWPRGKSGADGSFAVAHERPDWATIAARTPALAGTAKRAPGAIAIVAEPARTLEGVARDATTRRPLGGVTVTAMHEAQHTTEATVTDAQGRYFIGGLPPGRYWAYAERDGYDMERPKDDTEGVELRRAVRVTHDFALKPQRRIAGRVHDEQGAPVGGADIHLGVEGMGLLYGDMKAWGQGESSGRTAADGTFTLGIPQSVTDTLKTANMRASLVALKTGYAAGQTALPAPGAAAAIVLPRGHAVAGRIAGADGAPAAEVEVAVVVMGPMFAMQPLATLPLPPWTRSDAQGRFAVRLNAGRHALAFRKAGHATKILDVPDPASAGPVDVVLDPAAAIIGRVGRADGRPVPGAAVSLRKPDEPEETEAAATRTDEEGRFTLSDLEAGTYELAVSHEDGVEATRTVQAPSADVRVDLAPAGTLRGRVLDAATRSPLPAYWVTVSRPRARGGDDDFADSRVEEIQGTDGAFAIDGLPPGAAEVTIQAEGYRNKKLEDVAISSDDDAPPLEVALEPGATVRGRVTAEGAGVADAYVYGGVDPGRTEVTATTDENGDYELKGLPAGAITVQVTKRGYQAARRAVDAAPGARVDFALTRGLSLRGVVVAGDAPVPEARVSASSGALDAAPQDATTDASGRFTISGLSPARYTIEATAAGKGRAKVEDVDVATAGEVRLVIDAGGHATIVGTVARAGTPDGSPAMVMILVEGAEGENAHAIADDKGAFRVDDAPTGRVVVVASAMAGSSTRSSAPVELTLAPRSETAVTLEFREDAVVSGTVFRNGAPLPGVRVAFQPSGAASSAGSSTRTDSGGRYRVGLALGAYAVMVSGERTSYTTELEVKESAVFDLDVTGGAVRGRVVDAASDAPIAGVEVSLWKEGKTDGPVDTGVTSAEGTFEAPWLREGRYRAVTSKKGYGQQAAELSVARGETAELRLALRAADGITLAVTDARDGRSLSAIVVVRDPQKRIVANRHAGPDESGAVNIPLADGPYLVSASASGYGTATLSVTSPARGVAVGLTPGGTLVVETARPRDARIRLVQPDGEEYVKCWCNGIAEIKLTGRRTSVENVTAGAYTLELASPPGGEPVTRPVLIQEGQTTTVTID
jgi:5-hydroxyisourate hydrolase-like protein (transthyretin family)